MIKILKLKKTIKKNEGYRNIVYADQLGYATIGYGHLIKKSDQFDPSKKFTKKYLEKIFEKDFDIAIKSYKKIFKRTALSNNIEEVVIEMIFQLGSKKFKKFIKFKEYIKKNKLHLAALEMLDSKWYTQTPKRVEGLIKTLLNFET